MPKEKKKEDEYDKVYKDKEDKTVRSHSHLYDG